MARPRSHIFTTTPTRLFPSLAWSDNDIRADIVVIDLVRRQQGVGARAGRVQERRQGLKHVNRDKNQVIVIPRETR